VDNHGNKWTKISKIIGRSADACKDRYRNHLYKTENRNYGDLEFRAFLCVSDREYKLGPWSKEEEDRLSEIVLSMTVEQGKDSERNIFWKRVSEEMGGQRGRTQCRIKWYVLHLILHISGSDVC
jgi:hypothetical protein